MVKAKAPGLIILGLSDYNIERMRKGDPIKFNLSELGLPPMDVLIFTGKDEQEMTKTMRPFIDPTRTIIKDDNAKKN